MENTLDKYVAEASSIEQATFYKKTYHHVAMAILSFIVVETLLLRIVPQDLILSMMSTKFIWLFVIGAFWLASMLSDRLAFSPDRNTQYMGLGLYVFIEAIIFMPMITIATLYSGSEMLIQAALITFFLFAGLTATVFLTKTDFSFLRTGLIIGGFISLGLIIVGAIFGFNLGLWFSVGMVVLASGSILYQTSQLKYNYSTNQYVGASLQLFASIMLLFWYILRILMRRK